MFEKVLQKLDAWVIEQNEEYRADGLVPLKRCTIRLLGQLALLERGLQIPLAATQDVDVYADYEHAVQKKFEELLKQRGLLLDPVGHEGWMPEETHYEGCYSGDFVTGLIAHQDFVLIAKALKAPEKNRVLLTDYLAKGASARFLELARKYEIDLELFL